MKCPSCTKEITPDRLFCTWCEAFVPDPRAGRKAGVFRRWVAMVIDPALVAAAFLIPTGLLGGLLGDAGVALAMLAVLGVLVWMFKLFTRGMTPGKLLLGEKVVDRRTGKNPGFVKMWVREIVGKFVSGLFFGLGFFWAIFDADGQAWHDKIAGTVVVLRKPAPVAAPVEEREAVPA